MNTCLAAVRITLAFMTLVGAGGCASTELRSFIDPDFPQYACDTLLVAVQLPHLDQQADAETIFVKELAEADTACLRSVDVLPPTRTFDDAEMFGTLEQKGIGAVLVVRETEFYEEQEYIPRTSTTSTYGRLSARTYYAGNTARTRGVVDATSYTHTTGGYYVSKPRVRHRLELYDMASRKVVWVGGAFTKGNSNAGFKTLISALAEETVKTFRKTGLTPGNSRAAASRPMGKGVGNSGPHEVGHTR